MSIGGNLVEGKQAKLRNSANEHFRFVLGLHDYFEQLSQVFENAEPSS